MGLFSSRQARQTPAADRSGAATATDPVQAARTKARRRLVGAAVLLGVGVVGFPLLFETQPRPIPVDIPIDIPRKDNAPSLPLPPPRVASATAPTPRVSSGVISERPAADAVPKRDGATSTAPSAAKSADASPPAARPAAGASTAAAAKASAPPAASSGGAAATSSAAAPTATPTDDGARAKALLEGKAVESRSTPASRAADTSVAAAAPKSVAAPSAAPEPRADAAAANGRFVVQVAAYSEAGAAREMRQRVEKLGLKSYTQVIEIDGAKRIRVRVGPFAARDEADKAAATLKGAGLPAAVLSL